MTETKPFWETAHPYHAPDSNYYADGYSNQAHYHDFENWADFIEEFESWDEDYNFLYRWDFEPSDPDLEEDDEDWRPPHLVFCYIAQRKGTFTWARINNPRPEDEAEVRAYLEKRWNHVQRLWAPLSGVSG